MCGIVGYVHPSKKYDLSLALQDMQMRGPDAQGEWSDDRVHFGHVRLSILDLSNGAQPMLDDQEKVCLTYNGEIYNYKLIKQQLIDLGYKFKTECDTEVIIYSFLEWGVKSFSKFDGIFAFAIYDRVNREIHLVRDRCGIKPLFYKLDSGAMYFASNLTTLQSITGESMKLNEHALVDYLAFQTPMAPASFFTSVAQLEPAHYLSYSLSSHKVSRNAYWEIPSSVEQIGFQDAEDQMHELITQSVQAQMMSDVPIGAFLSGGVDSSLMVHYMANSCSNKLRTFSVAFNQKEFDETEYAIAVSKKYGTEHQIIDAPNLSPELLASSIANLDQPLADPAYPMTWYLSQETKKHITVAISGDGGDELFGGYSKFHELEKCYPKNFKTELFAFLKSISLLPGSLTRQSLSGRDMLVYKKIETGLYSGSRKDLRNFLSTEILQTIQAQPLLKWRELVDMHGGFNSKLALMKADLWTYLSENCLAKTDRASMSWGLEVRVPLLSNSILERALSLDESLHFKNNKGKQLLLALAKRHLPRQVWDRKKHGFSVPLRDLFSGAWKDLGESLVRESKDIAPFMNHRGLERQWQQAQNAKGSVRMMYTLLTLLIWLKAHRSRISF